MLLFPDGTIFFHDYFYNHVYARKSSYEKASFPEAFIWRCLKSLLLLETNLQCIIVMFLLKT